MLNLMSGKPGQLGIPFATPKVWLTKALTPRLSLQRGHCTVFRV